MEKISEMIKRLCPEGVEKKRLGDVCFVLRGKSLSKKDLNTGNVPIILYGELYTTYKEYIEEIVSHADIKRAETATICSYDNILLPISSTTKEAQIGKASVVKVQGEVFVGGDAIILKHHQNAAFLMYLLNSYWFEKYKMRCVSGTTIMHLSPNDLSNIEIPLPPLPIQQEIVRILDSFTSMITNLETELASRQKQYEYYRNKLLTFDENDESVEWKTLGDIGEVRMCKRILKSQTNSEAGIPFYKIGTFGKKADAYISKEVYDEYRTKYNYPKKGDILISAAGTIGRTVEFDGTPSYFQDSNIVWIEHEEKLVTNKYLKFFYSIAEWKIQNGGSVSRLYNDNLKSTSIPIPTLQKQQEIVSILDTFETLISNINLELKARKKLYEYYREKLLTFE